MKILIIDNYDSFTFNLYQLVGELLQNKLTDFSVEVFCNDQISLKQIRESNYDRIIISPGPGDPSEESYFGVCRQVLLELGKTIPVFGVCLGIQGMAHYYGGKVVKGEKPVHGKISQIEHDGRGIFKNLPQNLEVMRYHSLVADKNCLPDCLEISAKVSGGGEIMGLRHKKYPIEGVQFHPESFATEGGKQMLKNFIYM